MEKHVSLKERLTVALRPSVEFVAPIRETREDDKRPWHERPYVMLHASGVCEFTHPITGEPLEGFLYFIDDQGVLAEKKTGALFCPDTRDSWKSFEGSDTVAVRLRNQYQSDLCQEAYNQKIARARDLRASQIAGQDSAYVNIIRAALEESGGKEPVPAFVYNNVPLFPTGRNATHLFYDGYKDGTHYRVAYYPFEMEDAIEHQLREEGLDPCEVHDGESSEKKKKLEIREQELLASYSDTQQTLVERERRENTVFLEYVRVKKSAS